MVRASAEAKEGRYIRDELVARLWEDNTERIKLLAVNFSSLLFIFSIINY